MRARGWERGPDDYGRMCRMINESLPDGHVETLENQPAMAALYFTYDSVGQVHETLRRARAMEAESGITSGQLGTSWVC
jgi:hypothetical protein